MEEILDQPLNDKKKDEMWINRITCLARIGSFMLISYDFYIFYTLSGNSTDENFVIRSTTIFALIFILSFIYYNFILARAEWTRKYITGVTSIWSTGFALLIYAMLIYSNLEGVSRLAKYNMIGYRMIFFLCLVVMLTLISWREMTYLIRDQRLKRLNN